MVADSLLFSDWSMLLQRSMASKGKSLVPFLTKCLATMGESGGLDRALEGCKVVAASPGHCTFSLTVDQSHANR